MTTNDNTMPSDSNDKGRQMLRWAITYADAFDHRINQDAFVGTDRTRYEQTAAWQSLVSSNLAIAYKLDTVIDLLGKSVVVPPVEPTAPVEPTVKLGNYFTVEDLNELESFVEHQQNNWGVVQAREAMTRLKAEYCHHGHPHQCYGVIWECQNCHKTYCCIEGTDTDQICDRCWSEENPEEAAAIGDQLEGTESASVYEFHAKTFVTDSIKLDVGIKPSDSTGRQDNQPFVGIHGHDLNQIIKFKLTDVLFGFDLVAVTPPLRDAMETLRALSEVEEPGYDKEFAEHLAAARLLITDIFKLPPDEEQVQATIANMNIGGTNDHTE